MAISFIQGEEGRLIILFLAGLGARRLAPYLAGLKPVTANGTNRIGILLGNLTATHHFHQRQLTELKQE
ncbi:MAG: hypothetical protein M1488_02335 [Gammaproteobacteria bacterium]|jgi:uncharacterized membrane protein YfcA|nr:hypothetical protein [Gammaproteobacteria bacterium]